MAVALAGGLPGIGDAMAGAVRLSKQVGQLLLRQTGLLKDGVKRTPGEVATFRYDHQPGGAVWVAPHQRAMAASATARRIFEASASECSDELPRRQRRQSRSH